MTRKVRSRKSSTFTKRKTKKGEYRYYGKNGKRITYKEGLRRSRISSGNKKSRARVERVARGKRGKRKTSRVSSVAKRAIETRTFDLCSPYQREKLYRTILDDTETQATKLRRGGKRAEAQSLVFFLDIGIDEGKAKKRGVQSLQGQRRFRNFVALRRFLQLQKGSDVDWDIDDGMCSYSKRGGIGYATPTRANPAKVKRLTSYEFVQPEDREKS